MNVKYVKFGVLEQFMTRILMKAGVPENDARKVADVLITADKLGFDSHGVNRLKPIYLDRIKDGIMNPVTRAETVRESPATAVIDGHHGMGHVIASGAMEISYRKSLKVRSWNGCRQELDTLWIRRVLSLYGRKKNMIGITGTNARPSIAPTFWG